AAQAAFDELIDRGIRRHHVTRVGASAGRCEEWAHDNMRSGRFRTAATPEQPSVSSPFVSSASGLVCDGVSVAAIAEAAGTPVYVYSAATIRANYRAIDEAFADYPHRIHYALKANSTLAIARLLRSLGSAADANSGGEIQVAERAGFSPEQVVFTGVGKT